MIIKIEPHKGDCAIIFNSEKNDFSFYFPPFDLSADISKNFHIYNIFSICMYLISKSDKKFAEFLNENENYYKKKVKEIMDQMQTYDHQDKSLRIIK